MCCKPCNACTLQVKLCSLLASGTLWTSVDAFLVLCQSVPQTTLTMAAASLSVLLALLLALLLVLSRRKCPVMLLDFYTYHPPECLAGTVPEFVEGMGRSGRWTDQSLQFMDKVSSASGLGDRTYLPEGKPQWNRMHDGLSAPVHGKGCTWPGLVDVCAN